MAAALLHCASSLSMSTCLQTVTAMDDAALRKVFETAFARMEFYDAPPREFEHIQLTFEVQISAAAYGQLKRHRMMSQSAQSYLPSLGLTVPPAVEEAGLADAFRAHGEVAAALFADILAQQPDAAPYALTNAHRRRVVVTTNLRDLYHFCRLREDAHAQWDIRRLAAVMREQAQRAMPLSTLLLCGKDSYVERYCALFGRRPAMDPAAPAAE